MNAMKNQHYQTPRLLLLYKFDQLDFCQSVFCTFWC